MAEQDDAVWLHAGTQVTLVELSHASGLEPDVLRELVEYGALALATTEGAEWSFSAVCVVRVRTAARLKADLGSSRPPPWRSSSAISSASSASSPNCATCVPNSPPPNAKMKSSIR